LLQCDSHRLLASDCMLVDAVLTTVLLHVSIAQDSNESRERNPRDRDQDQGFHKSLTPITNHLLEPVSGLHCFRRLPHYVCKGVVCTKTTCLLYLFGLHAAKASMSLHVHVDTTMKLTK